MTYRIASLAIISCLAVAGCHSAPEPTPTEAAQSVSVGKVAARSLSGGLTASGQLVARELAAVSPEIAGYRVDRVLVEEGAAVRKGQPLAILDDGLLAPQIAQAQATLDQQRVAADRARAEAERVRGLDDTGVLSNEAIAERRIAVRTAEAQVNVARAQLRDLQVRKQRLVIRAPVSGTVIERSVRPGDTSQVGSVMFTILRDNLVELDAELPEAKAGSVKAGDRAAVLLASGRRVEGKVRLIGASVDSETGLVGMRIALPVSSDIRPGGFAKAIFQSSDRPVPAVPETAIRMSAAGAQVQTLDKQNRVKSVPVRTGIRSSGYVELVAGPPMGTRVLLSGGAFVLEGDKVNPSTEAAR
ncbi:efflux RND transporter periplasmic adaptor subunit [Novosphingobium pentaromativorans]|uniref:Uncharacterized protein n=1 Tax=Novosphingobium pentaromativorans US6-1 TaxID=1088721 RepID=G6E735_9SPHN|nr:efflux RND transporter periplasmic adaptor subunit [Novosphingobium pentaromativorans]AIT81766.1 secretion protein HlyD [Novosphingobium pentaromativorans US6-1]EHJ62862.1 hypothetical protein NSU_0156 [Novosphingobium pentaromativorans US6-1]